MQLNNSDLQRLKLMGFDTRFLMKKLSPEGAKTILKHKNPTPKYLKEGELPESTFSEKDSPFDSAETNTALKNKAKESGIPLSTLKKVYERGLGAWKSSANKKIPPQQWAMGRVNSFISGEGGARKADADLLKTFQEEPINTMVVAPAWELQPALRDRDDVFEEANGGMAISQLRSMAENIHIILQIIDPNYQLDPWMAAKITEAETGLTAVADSLKYGN